MEAIDLLRDPTFWGGLLTLAAPLLLGILGAQIGAAAGTINLGTEGIFALGAVIALIVSQSGAGPAWMLVAGATAGILPGLLIGALSGQRLPLVAVGGLAVTLLGGAIALSIVHVRFDGAALPVSPIPSLALPRLSSLPYVGRVLFTQPPTLYLAVIVALLVAFLMNRTPLGLAIRACGDNPTALAVQGRSPFCIRAGAVTLGSILIGLAGASLMLTSVPAFSPDMVVGRGLLCLSLAVLVGPRVLPAMGAALLLALLETIRGRLAGLWATPLPAEAATILPLALVIIALLATRRRVQA